MNTARLDAKARQQGFASFQAWFEMLDHYVRTKTRSDGTTWGFTTWVQYVEWCLKTGQAVPGPYVDAAIALTGGEAWRSDASLLRQAVENAILSRAADEAMATPRQPAAPARRRARL